jgi:hypothetical protein
MPSVLESGKLQLSTREASTYCVAARRLHEACATALDLTQPITVESWILLQTAHAALCGDLGLLDRIVAKVEAEIASRTLRN